MSQKNLLVVGGTGSFGYKVATALAEEYSQVTIFSRDEKKQWEMKQKFPDFRYMIGDVRDFTSLKAATRNQTVVFYAAALKQVPSCEEFPVEALKTNCLGAVNLCRAAWECDVNRVIYLSTDKAVQPINVLGISKAFGEKIITSQDAGGPTFCCVRYGNILLSRGSVIPTWIRQHRLGEPLVITDPAMTRFIMALSDSVNLVRYACSAPSGSVLVWKAPALQITALADLVLRYILNEPKYPTRISERRPGEKLHETLVCQDELHRTVDSGQLITIHHPKDGPIQGNLKTPFTSEQVVDPNAEYLPEMLRIAMLDAKPSL